MTLDDLYLDIQEKFGEKVVCLNPEGLTHIPITIRDASIIPELLNMLPKEMELVLTQSEKPWCPSYIQREKK